MIGMMMCLLVGVSAAVHCCVHCCALLCTLLLCAGVCIVLCRAVGHDVRGLCGPIIRNTQVVPVWYFAEQYIRTRG